MHQNYRLKVIEDLDAFLDEKKQTLGDVIKKIGWDEESLQDELKVPCPRDCGHWIPESRMSRHDETCSWVKEGYPKDEQDKLPPSSQFFYEQSSAVIPIVIDKETQAKVLSECGLLNLSKEQSEEILEIPKTIDRWTVHLNPEQRLTMYDYIVNESKAANKPNNVTVEDLMFDFEKKEDQDGKPKSRLEIMAELRDYKRRRQSYRAKNVHITKKSYTEVIKEVIENQLTFLAETRKQEHLENAGDSKAESTRFADKSPERHNSPVESRKSESRHRSRRDRSESHSPKHKKHKRDRSHSKSRHKHKKSHRKHKKSRD